MQDWITCIHIQMPGFGRCLFHRKNFVQKLSFWCCDLNFRTFFQKFRLFITVQICKHHITFYIMPVKNTVGICKILFYVMFQKNTSKQIFLSSEIMFQVIFIIRRLNYRIRNIGSRDSNPGNCLRVDLS